MENNHQSYSIIDEPRPGALRHLIVNPTAILLAAILVPLFWQPPYSGQNWIPFLWLSINSFLLGSPKLARELTLSVVGAILITGMPFIAHFLGYYFAQEAGTAFIREKYGYIYLLTKALFFTLLYIICLMQNVAYSIYQYLEQK